MPLGFDWYKERKIYFRRDSIHKSLEERRDMTKNNYKNTV